MKNLLLMSAVFLFVAMLACLPYLQTSTDDFVYKGQSLSVWIANLEDPSADIRCQAAQTLAELGESAKDAVPALIASTHDEDPTVRWWSIRALSIIDPKNKDVIPAISNGIVDKEPMVAREAIRATMHSVRPEGAPPVGTFVSN